MPRSRARTRAWWSPNRGRAACARPRNTRSCLTPPGLRRGRVVCMVRGVARLLTWSQYPPSRHTSASAGFRRRARRVASLGRRLRCTRLGSAWVGLRSRASRGMRPGRRPLPSGGVPSHLSGLARYLPPSWLARSLHQLPIWASGAEQRRGRRMAQLRLRLRPPRRVWRVGTAGDLPPRALPSRRACFNLVRTTRLQGTARQSRAPQRQRVNAQARRHSFKPRQWGSSLPELTRGMEIPGVSRARALPRWPPPSRVHH
jgi:hypothetical protein